MAEFDTSVSRLMNEPDVGGGSEPIPPITFLEVSINITSPSSNDVLGSSVTVSGTATCTFVSINTQTGVRTETNAPNLMNSVRVQFGSGGAFQLASRQGPTWEQWQITRSRGSGSLTITARIEAEETDGTAYNATDSVSVQVDATGPALAITTPPNETTLTWNDGGVPIVVGGTASDTLTGVSVVEWDLNGSGVFTQAIAQSPNNWSTWTATMVLDAPGEHNIAVRARDGLGNETMRHLTLNVAIVFQPKDPDDVVSMAVYLDDLQNFASQRTKTSTQGNPIDRQLLETTFHQPFDALTYPLNEVTANQPVHQVRLGIEVLRKYLGVRNIQVPSAAQLSYVQEAYSQMLYQLGTSYEELRLARVADSETRTTLASRLGIDLSPSRPDELDSLVLDMNSITEDDLQRIFGIEDSSRDAIEAGVIPEPEMLTWRLMNLRSLWQNQDADAPSDLQNLGLTVDPDVIVESDLVDLIAGNSAYDLWKSRVDWVEGQLTSLRQMREAETSDIDGFDAIASSVLGPVSTLTDLADQHQQGEDIKPQLATRQLTLKPFLHLMRVRNLASSAQNPDDNVVLDTEWDDVYSILVQVQKIQESSSTWRDEELAQNLILGPDDFKLPEVGSTQAELPRWRATPKARRDWLDKLEGRINQEKNVVQGLRAAVSETEEVTMPPFRDALVMAANVDPDFEKAGNILTQELAIDVRGSGVQKTTRVNQAIATLQTVLFSLRTERFITPHPSANWMLDTATGYTESQFDQEWAWIGAYATWRAAMMVFGYPENNLSPLIREYHQPNQDPTDAYVALVGRLRNTPRLNPTQARVEASEYLGELRTELGGSLPGDITNNAFTITDQMSEADLAERKVLVNGLFSAVTNPHLAPNYLKEVFYFVPMLLAQELQKSSQYLAALDWFQNVFAYNFVGSERKIYHGLVLEETLETKFQRTIDWLLDGLNPHDIAMDRANAYTTYTVLSIVQCFLEFANSEFTRDTYESIPRARALYVTALGLLDDVSEIEPSTLPDNPFPTNPVLRGLRMHVELNLFKLRNGLNIAGMKRQTAVEVAESQPLDGVPAAGLNGQSGSPRSLSFRPTPYRYSALIERAKQLVNVAQQIESSYLSAIEKYDAESYSLIRARQDIQLAHASIRLQDLRVSEAESGVRLAELQRERSEIQEDHYQDLIDEGLIGLEQASLGFMTTAAALHTSAAVISAAGGVLDSVKAAFTFGIAGDPTAKAAQMASSLAAAASTGASITQTLASYERRKAEWQFQRDMARHDTLVGTQQISIANDHVRVVEQERANAEIQAGHAEETLEFLANKFTSAEFYDWMRATMGLIYRYFLQQATAMAQLAQHQLAFERQEVPPDIIQSDYWEIPDDAGTGSYGEGDESDRQGITGSARLLQHMTKLDLYAFETDRRKLQISQTFSLSQLAPAEFQRFRETGILPFTLPMELFDHSFPGGYLRLIRRVSTSVIALVPPTYGIRATLRASGISRVAIGKDTVHTIVSGRDPEIVALTSPINATGMFELQPENDMLMPFEGMGVETAWEFRLPKAANPFDYRSLADVLVTVEYTALHSEAYQQHVLQQISSRISADRPFSLRRQFADQWYDLHNPEYSPTPMTISFDTRREDFPPNIEELKLEHVVLSVSRVDGETFELPVDHLHFTEKGGSFHIGGAATTVEGVISTRRSNGVSWLPITGNTVPVGTWELALPNTEEVKNRFKNDEIEDILLVFTYQGQTPAWPA